MLLSFRAPAQRQWAEDPRVRPNDTAHGCMIRHPAWSGRHRGRSPACGYTTPTPLLRAGLPSGKCNTGTPLGANVRPGATVYPRAHALGMRNAAGDLAVQRRRRTRGEDQTPKQTSLRRCGSLWHTSQGVFLGPRALPDVSMCPNIPSSNGKTLTRASGSQGAPPHKSQTPNHNFACSAAARRQGSATELARTLSRSGSVSEHPKAADERALAAGARARTHRARRSCFPHPSRCSAVRRPARRRRAPRAPRARSGRCPGCALRVPSRAAAGRAARRQPPADCVSRL